MRTSKRSGTVLHDNGRLTTRILPLASRFLCLPDCWGDGILLAVLLDIHREAIRPDQAWDDAKRSNRSYGLRAHRRTIRRVGIGQQSRATTDEVSSHVFEQVWADNAMRIVVVYADGKTTLKQIDERRPALKIRWRQFVDWISGLCGIISSLAIGRVSAFGIWSHKKSRQSLVGRYLR